MGAAVFKATLRAAGVGCRVSGVSRFRPRNPTPGTRHLLALASPGLAEVPQQAHADPGGAWTRVIRRDVRLVAIGVRRARDVEVDPRDVADELLQEQPGGDRAGAAATRVAHVGHGGLDL